MTDELETLAKRCEEASGPDMALDHDISRALDKWWIPESDCAGPWTASLDAAYAEDIMSMFKSFHDVGVTVLIATHDRALIDRHQANGARVLHLDHGRLEA